jgi:hypothetical protein
VSERTGRPGFPPDQRANHREGTHMRQVKVKGTERTKATD